MADEEQNLVEARENLERAKAHFFDTLGKIEQSFSPDALAEHAGSAIHAKLSAVGKSSVEVAKKRPLALVVGATAVMAMVGGRLFGMR